MSITPTHGQTQRFISRLTEDVQNALFSGNITSLKTLIATTEYISTSTPETPLVVPATTIIVNLWLKSPNDLHHFEPFRAKIYSLLQSIHPPDDITLCSTLGLSIPYRINHLLFALSTPFALKLYSQATASTTSIALTYHNTELDLTISLPYSSVAIECIKQWIETHTMPKSLSESIKEGLTNWAQDSGDTALLTALQTLSSDKPHSPISQILSPAIEDSPSIPARPRSYSHEKKRPGFSSQIGKHHEPKHRSQPLDVLEKKQPSSTCTAKAIGLPSLMLPILKGRK